MGIISVAITLNLLILLRSRQFSKTNGGHDVSYVVIDTSTDSMLGWHRDAIHHKSGTAGPSIYWLPSHEIYFSSAFLDTRLNQNYVRVLGVQHKRINQTLTCNLRVGNRTIKYEATTDLIFPHWPPDSLYLAAFYHCALVNTPSAPPDSVSMCASVGHPCVTIPLTTVCVLPDTLRKDIAICGKAYTGQMDAGRLVEWVELNRIVGVENIMVYDAQIQGSAQGVLDQYESIQVVRRIPFPFQTAIINHSVKHFRLTKAEYYSIFQQSALVSLNDCLYRFLGQYEYLLIIDYDEIMLPLKEETIFFMAQRQQRSYPNVSGLTFPTVWHFTDFGPVPQPQSTALPKVQLHMMEYIHRTPISTNQPKSIVRSDSALSVNWHAVVSSHPMSGYGRNVLIRDMKDGAYIHHYRGACVDKFPRTYCDEMLRKKKMDAIVPRYNVHLRERVRHVLKLWSGIL